MTLSPSLSAVDVQCYKLVPSEPSPTHRGGLYFSHLSALDSDPYISSAALSHSLRTPSCTDSPCSSSNDLLMLSESVDTADTVASSSSRRKPRPPLFSYYPSSFQKCLQDWSCRECTQLTYVWPYCSQHALQKAHLRIGTSRLGNFLGLFADANLNLDQQAYCLAHPEHTPVAFDAGTTIADYIGELLNQMQFFRRYRGHGESKADTHGPYSILYPIQRPNKRLLAGKPPGEKFDPEEPLAVLDGALFRSYASFINASKSEEDENVTLEFVGIDDARKYGRTYPGDRDQRWARVKAKRTIFHGEELLWYYGDTFWGSEEPEGGRRRVDPDHSTSWLDWLS